MNRHSLKKSKPSSPKEHLEGVRGHKFKNVRKKPNSWTDREQRWHTYAYSSGTGHELNINPLIPEGHREVVTYSNMWEGCQTAGPIGNKFVTRVQIRVHVNGYSWLRNYPLETSGALWGEGVRGHILNGGKTATNTCIIMLRLSLAKPRNPASITLWNRIVGKLYYVAVLNSRKIGPYLVVQTV